MQAGLSIAETSYWSSASTRRRYQLFDTVYTRPTDPLAYSVVVADQAYMFTVASCQRLVVSRLMDVVGKSPRSLEIAEICQQTR